MPEVQILVDGQPLRAAGEATVASVLLGADRYERGLLCGMGVCYECRVTIDGRPAQRACLRLCREGMEIRIDAR